MRSVFIVCYDISNERRLRRVYRAMRGFGDHIQLSVFRCELSSKERAELVATIAPIINHAEDQVLIIDLGPSDGRAWTAFEALGRPYFPPTRHTLVV